MEIRIDIAPLAPKEEKLQDIADYLDQLKDKFAIWLRSTMRKKPIRRRLMHLRRRLTLGGLL